MGENAPQKRADEHVIRTPEDAAHALVKKFLENDEAGDNEANDELVRQFGEWKRRNR